VLDKLPLGVPLPVGVNAALSVPDCDDEALALAVGDREGVHDTDRVPEALGDPERVDESLGEALMDRVCVSVLVALGVREVLEVPVRLGVPEPLPVLLRVGEG